MPLPQTGRGLAVLSGRQKTIKPSSFDYLFHWPDGVTRLALTFFDSCRCSQASDNGSVAIKRVRVNFLVNTGIVGNKLIRSTE